MWKHVDIKHKREKGEVEFEGTGKPQKPKLSLFYSSVSSKSSTITGRKWQEKLLERNSNEVSQSYYREEKKQDEDTEVASSHSKEEEFFPSEDEEKSWRYSPSLFKKEVDKDYDNKDGEEFRNTKIGETETSKINEQ